MRQGAVEAFRGLAPPAAPRRSRTHLNQCCAVLIPCSVACDGGDRGFNVSEAEDSRIGSASYLEADDERQDRRRRGVLRYRSSAEHPADPRPFCQVQRIWSVRPRSGRCSAGSAAAELVFVRTLLDLLQDEDAETWFGATEAIEQWALRRRGRTSFPAAEACFVLTNWCQGNCGANHPRPRSGGEVGIDVFGFLFRRFPCRWRSPVSRACQIRCKGQARLYKTTQGIAISRTILVDGRGMLGCSTVSEKRRRCPSGDAKRRELHSRS